MFARDEEDKTASIFDGRMRQVEEPTSISSKSHNQSPKPTKLQNERPNQERWTWLPRPRPRSLLPRKEPIPTCHCGKVALQFFCRQGRPEKVNKYYYKCGEVAEKCKY